jgi:hypothetical protein
MSASIVPLHFHVLDLQTALPFLKVFGGQRSTDSFHQAPQLYKPVFIRFTNQLKLVARRLVVFEFVRFQRHDGAQQSRAQMELVDNPIRRRDENRVKGIVVEVIDSRALRNIRVKAKCAQFRGTSFCSEVGSSRAAGPMRRSGRRLSFSWGFVSYLAMRVKLGALDVADTVHHIDSGQHHILVRVLGTDTP